MYRNDTNIPVKECVDASTTSWHIPVSIGSSIGAVLALSIIVFIVMLSRCPSLVRQPRTAAAESSKYDSMSSHYHDDTSTPCHHYDRDDDMFSQSSDGDILADPKMCRHSHHHSPQSLADRLCNGGRMVNGVGKPNRGAVPLRRVERTLSLTDKRHQPNPYRMRQARLAHLHANFHSLQSDPGSMPARAAPRVSITDFSTSAVNTNLSSVRKSHHSSLPVTNMVSNKGIGAQTFIMCSKPTGFRESPKLMYRIDSGTSNSEPTMTDTKRNMHRARPPELKNLPKTIHMSIDGDTLV